MFSPQNPEKYHGNLKNIIYRSHPELIMMQFFDQHPKVLRWRSEEIAIPYRSVDGRHHFYFPDFFVHYENRQGILKDLLIEYKPKVQTTMPIKGKKGPKRLQEEMIVFGRNLLKWKAAAEYCLYKQWKFEVFHEDHLRNLNRALNI
jgi:TnsA endonuclease N terminal